MYESQIAKIGQIRIHVLVIGNAQLQFIDKEFKKNPSTLFCWIAYYGDL